TQARNLSEDFAPRQGGHCAARRRIYPHRDCTAREEGCDMWFVHPLLTGDCVIRNQIASFAINMLCRLLVLCRQWDAQQMALIYQPDFPCFRVHPDAFAPYRESGQFDDGSENEVLCVVPSDAGEVFLQIGNGGPELVRFSGRLKRPEGLTLQWPDFTFD